MLFVLVCITWKGQGIMDKDNLLKATIQAMGYARSSASLFVVEVWLKDKKDGAE